jgi:tetrahydromethanopterin S-methyltransferase subunit D
VHTQSKITVVFVRKSLAQVPTNTTPAAVATAAAVEAGTVPY